MTEHISKYPNTFYRVSLKAIIRNEQGEVLCVKEDGSPAWSLPGGGIDHGESDRQALAREIYEEVAIEAPFRSHPIGIEQMWLESRQAYLMWIVYKLEFDGDYSWGVGQDGDAAEFVDPKLFKDSAHRAERLVYKWCAERQG